MKLLPLLILFFSATIAASQNKVIEKIKEGINKTDATAHLTFLASDEMRGRGTGSSEIAIAAKYIATQFSLMGVKNVPGSTSYFQEVGLQQIFPPTMLNFRLGNETYRFRDDLVLLKGKSWDHKGELVFVGYGTPEDFNQVDVKGKVVVAYAGSSGASTMREAYLKDAPSKYELVKDRGGLALIEVVAFRDVPWQRIAERFAGGRISVARNDVATEEMPHLWMASSINEGFNHFLQQKSGEASFTIEVRAPQALTEKNVIGWVEGTDASLKQEYVVLSAHYDHLGVKRNATPDSIYNGARDNAIGTTAILEAAKFFSKNPPKRSLLIIAFCAEEAGLLGSRWYAEHPMIPLGQTVYNLDCDGAGYNDKTIANLVDLGRTTMDDLLKKGCETFGLTLTGDPAPEMNLYERSDNYNFALKGVPAVDFSPGVRKLDDEVMKYYHQPGDEAQSLDFDYLEKFFRAYVYSAFLIGNSPTRPFWKMGDKFEAAGKKLYGLP